MQVKQKNVCYWKRIFFNGKKIFALNHHLFLGFIYGTQKSFNKRKTKKNTNELKSNLVLSNQWKVKVVTIMNFNFHTDKQLNLYLFSGKF